MTLASLETETTEKTSRSEKKKRRKQTESHSFISTDELFYGTERENTQTFPLKKTDISQNAKKQQVLFSFFSFF